MATSYKNYLRDEDQEHAQGMWSAIELNNTPNDDLHQGEGYAFSVTCAASDDTECSSR